MDDVLSFFERLFSTAPYCWLSWPVVAMCTGWLLTVCSVSAATQCAIRPRTAGGLVGIITAPFIHANLAHLVANVPPFVVLSWLVLRRDEARFLETSLMIAGTQGLLVWLMGRNAAHMGMSGVVFGFFGWLLGLAWFARTTPDLLIAAGALFFYGGMLAGVAPARNGTSWESHLFGLIAGAGAAWLRYAM